MIKIIAIIPKWSTPMKFVKNFATKICDFFPTLVKVLSLIKSTHSSGLADDDQLRQAYRNVGLKAFSEKRWADSLLYLSEAGEMNRNIRAHFMAGNFQDMNIIGKNLESRIPIIHHFSG